jgi:anti-sigma factor RsiW
MHQVIVDRLEDYLAEASDIPREFTAHLEACAECRTEVNEMREIGAAFEALRPPTELVPAPDFYARLNTFIEDRQARSFWRLFSWEPLFGRRVAFASLMALFVLGSFLVSRETEYAAGPSSPEQLIAHQEPSENPDAMLASLVGYRE